MIAVAVITAAVILAVALLRSADAGSMTSKS
jgi:hypothetical protein